LMQHPLVQEMARRHGKSGAQVRQCCCWTSVVCFLRCTVQCKGARFSQYTVWHCDVLLKYPFLQRRTTSLWHEYGCSICAQLPAGTAVHAQAACCIYGPTAAAVHCAVSCRC
jgi:hypothetical protein